MFIWIALIGCATTEPEIDAPADEAVKPEAPPAEGKAGKRKAGGKKSKKKGGDKGTSCPKGVRTNPSWEGEYPNPIVDVTQAVTVSGRIEPCLRRATTPCTVPAGLYNPWSTLDAEYVTVREVDRYTVLKDTKVGAHDAAAGSEVVVTQYLAEGFCMLEVGGAEVEAMCPGVGDDGETFQKLDGRGFETVQLVQVACEGGEPTWVDAATLMEQDGVRAGKVLEYGKVGPGE